MANINQTLVYTNSDDQAKIKTVFIRKSNERYYIQRLERRLDSLHAGWQAFFNIEADMLIIDISAPLDPSLPDFRKQEFRS